MRIVPALTVIVVALGVAPGVMGYAGPPPPIPPPPARKVVAHHTVQHPKTFAVVLQKLQEHFL